MSLNNSLLGGQNSNSTMADNLDLASNHLQSMRNVLRQFKTAANAANPQPEKIEKLKNQYLTVEGKVSKLVDVGHGRDWEPLKREAKQLRDEFARLDRAVASKQSAAAAERQAQESNSSDPISNLGGGGGKMGLANAQVVNTAPLDTEESLQRERLQGIVEVEQNMSELKGMYQDFNAMVHEQDGAIDNVEQNVDKSTKHVEKGVVELKGASAVQKSSRKWMCGLIVVLVIGGVIGVIVYFATRD